MSKGKEYRKHLNTACQKVKNTETSKHCMSKGKDYRKHLNMSKGKE